MPMPLSIQRPHELGRAARDLDLDRQHVLAGGMSRKRSQNPWGMRRIATLPTQ